MKLTIPKPTDVEAVTIRCVIPVRYEEEDIPNDFPLRKDDTWEVFVGIDTGIIKDWPKQTEEKSVSMKVCDEGCYYLLDQNGAVIASRECEYVPCCIPESYGDYVRFKIDPEGRVANWLHYCTLKNLMSSFFQVE